jgi:hypothetical protein
MTQSSTQKAAAWMRGQIEEHGVLYQDEAAAIITERFGDDCTYQNDNCLIEKTHCVSLLFPRKC